MRRVLTGILLDSSRNITAGSARDPEVNAGSCVDLSFGSSLPKGASEKNWINTDAKTGFFLVLRFYGTLEGYINKTWVINEFERIKSCIV